MIIGYARVSTKEQDIDLQTERLTEAGAEKIFQDKLSGTQASNRAQLQLCLDFVREGDTLIVTRLDRIARSSHDLHNIIASLEAKGVAFKCIQQGEVDTSTSTGKLMIGMLGAIAQFENDLRRERQREGILKAKAKGVYKGRKAVIDAERVRQMASEGTGPSAIAKQLGCHRQSVYRLLESRGE
ncbi:recombinase family protein [Sphingobium baderi]|uniref:Resolvase n=1 Tax=Sphingobium baderi TaxID=1332080 RepID=A0A0S3F5F9_9SPHN|nr:recombinase family protein [Sphingobium baderi]ALR22760.1 resolvase [Sphingobium baderi]